MTFVGLIVRNLATRRLRTLLTAAAVAISVTAVVTLGVVTASLENSAANVLLMGKADFIVAQKSVATALTSVVTEAQASRVARTAGVHSAVGVLVGTVHLNATNPVFIEIGVAPTRLKTFGVTIVSGHPYGAHARHEVMLGWQAAQSLHKRVGNTIRIGTIDYTVVGLYSVNQVFGNAAAMFPLTTLQANTRKPGTVTLVAVRVNPGQKVATVMARVDRDNPSLASVRLASQFGRIDRNLVFLGAAQTGAQIIALVVGVAVVLSAMLLSFVERIREFGVLRAVGWSRTRLLSLVMGEAVVISLLGAAAGVGLSAAFTTALEHVSSLRGVLESNFSIGVVGRGLYTAIGIGVLAALYPSVRAAMLRPSVALRRE
ncbi:MAG: ABC transporter permease [Actinomycetota bacterium]|jgi:putative ABC transport system permease protein|nr:ABC transporter permease [Actinomycetota bacterium]